MVILGMIIVGQQMSLLAYLLHFLHVGQIYLYGCQFMSGIVRKTEQVVGQAMSISQPMYKYCITHGLRLTMQNTYPK